MSLSNLEMNSILNNKVRLQKKNIPKVLQDILNIKKLSEIIINEDEEILLEISSKLSLYKDKIPKEEIEQFVDFITYYNNKNIGFTSPIFDGILAEGIRVNIICPPISQKSYIITMRTKSIENVDIKDLLELGTITKRALLELKMAIKNKENILIAGGTSTGKTTLINALLRLVNQNEKISILEDTDEIDYKTPFVSKLLTAQHQETGLNISLGDLVKTSLRMRPDRIIVGEIRGEEAYYLLHAMNTGHKGVISSIHANSSRDALRRLEVLSILGQKNLDILVPRAWISNNIDMIVYMEKVNDKRIVKKISRLEGLEGDTYILENIT